MERGQGGGWARAGPPGGGWVLTRDRSPGPQDRGGPRVRLPESTTKHNTLGLKTSKPSSQRPGDQKSESKAPAGRLFWRFRGDSSRHPPIYHLGAPRGCRHAPRSAPPSPHLSTPLPSTPPHPRSQLGFGVHSESRALIELHLQKPQFQIKPCSQVGLDEDTSLGGHCSVRSSTHRLWFPEKAGGGQGTGGGRLGV